MKTLDITTNIPVGIIVYYFGNEIPKGYIWCDGSIVSRKDYSALSKILNIDNNDTFALPDIENAIIFTGTN